MERKPSPEHGAPSAPQDARTQWLAIAGGLLAAWLWVVFAQLLGQTLGGESIGALSTLYMLLLFGPLMPIALAAGRAARIKVLLAGPRPGAWIAAGLATGLVGLGATILLSWINGGLVSGELPPGKGGLLALGFVLTLFQASVEEVTFRGWLQPALIARLGSVAGIAMTAAIFMTFHLAGGAREPLSLLAIFLAGVLFGLLAWRSGGLPAACAAHFAWNVTEDTGLGLVPNPGTSDLGSLFDLDVSGSALWGAGPEGLNSSVGTIAVLIALIVPLLLTAPRAAAAIRANGV